MKISELIPDNLNANKGTKRGNKAVADSLSRYGAARSIVIDRNGRIIAGNSTTRNAAAAGIDEVIIVPSDGTKIIAVQRTDLDLDETPPSPAILSPAAQYFCASCAICSWEGSFAFNSSAFLVVVFFGFAGAFAFFKTSVIQIS
jgi:hypothetical protein